MHSVHSNASRPAGLPEQVGHAFGTPCSYSAPQTPTQSVWNDPIPKPSVMILLTPSKFWPEMRLGLPHFPVQSALPKAQERQEASIPTARYIPGMPVPATQTDGHASS